MDLFNLYAKVTLDTSDYEKGIGNATQQGNTFFDVLKANLTSQAIISGAKKIADLFVKIGDAALNGYAEYEQLVGGVETLFKESSAKVQKYAENAYKTAGLSANDYMNTVTSFSASLLQSLGNDTEKAAEYADMAITDMSDNANKMGTTMDMIQNAYQGFAKQNYTMLDNLKLGYGGTKQEMERLLEDAEKIQQANGKMVSYSIDSYADMVDAIHVVQTEMGITGTTALEASTTIEGSINSMKAAWSNLMVGVADENADISALTKQFVDSTMTAANNVFPRVEQMIKGVGAAILGLGSEISELDGTAGKIINTIEDIGIAVAAIGAGTALQKLATGFGEAQVKVALLSMEVGKANLAQAALNGTMTIGQTAVALLTGKLKLSTLATAAATKAQTGLNAVMSANPILLVVSALGLLGVAVKKSIDDVDDLADSMVEQAETSEQAEANLAKLQERFAEFEGNPNKWGAEKRQEYLALKQAIAETEEQVVQLQEAEAEASAKAAEAAADPVNIFTQATEQYQQDALALYETFMETYEGIYSKIEGWFGPFDEAATSVETDINKMISAMQSQVEFNTTYSQNLDALKEYGLGGLSEAFQQSGKDGAAYAQAIVTAVEQAGGATSEGGQAIIQNFMEMNEKVTQSQSELAESMALMDGEFESELQSLGETYENTISDLDMGPEARTAATNTFKAFLDGMNSQIPQITSQANSLGGKIRDAIQQGIGKITVSVDAVLSNSATVKGYATGLDYVPYDDFLARLHKGEAVLTAEEAAAWRAGKQTISSESSVNSGSGVSITQYIEAVPQTPAELAAVTAAYFEQARWI